MTIEQLQAAKETLQKAMFSGVRKVEFADRTVEYNSIRDMKSAMDQLDAEISSVTGKTTSIKTSYASFRSGF